MTVSRPLVADHHFVLATRDTGYRSLAAAVAELIDNAIQGQASNVRVFVREEPAAERAGVAGERELTIGVLDDGRGMDADGLWKAVQFGGTERFNDRSGFGRFGMGLPNSSVSVTRRLEVYSWRRPGDVLHTYLDIDEVAQRFLRAIPEPTCRPLPIWAAEIAARSGTLVVWSRCDRLDYRKASTVAAKLRIPLGRMYRRLIWDGLLVSVNGETVAAVDPLFCHPLTGAGGGSPYGAALIYEITVPACSHSSTVTVRFSELPVAQWQGASAEEKRSVGIVGGAGVSFVRAGREIDYGWQLFGGKRRENYDDWWRCEVSFEPDLDELFGVTHSKQGVSPTSHLRSILEPDMEATARARRIVVDGVLVQAVDPLFLMEHARFYDETPVRAERVEARTLEVETVRGTKGTVRIRASVLPPHFQLAHPSQYGVKGAKLNKRHEVMRDYNGLLLCREHRQIDCIPPRWTKFQNYDANVKMEINFDPELDEYFGITTAKQQIVIDDDIWEKLQHSGKNGGGLKDLLEDLRRRFEDLQDELKAKAGNRTKDEPRPSVVAMEESAKFKGTVAEPSPAQQEEAQRNLEEVATARAEATGVPKEQILAQLAEETAKRRWEVEFSAIPEGPFYRPVRLSLQKRLVVNTEHPFYAKVYDAAPEIRAALEVLLSVLAERELEVKGGAETFYRAERQRWSERLRHALDTLVPDDTMVNKASAVAERMHIYTDVEVPAE